MSSDFDLVEHLERQKAFSLKTFGPGRRVDTVLSHMAKEAAEVRQKPCDVFEWVDVMLLAFDGAWRAGYRSDYIVEVIKDQCSVASLDDVSDVPVFVGWLECLRVEFIRDFGGCISPDVFLNYIERASEGKSRLDNRLCITWVNRALWAAAGAMAHGISAADIVSALDEKQSINERRNWPDWRQVEDGKAIEHVGASS